MTNDEYLYVIPFAKWSLGSPLLLADLRDSVYYMDFLKGQPDPPAQKEGSTSSRNKDQQALLQTHPWLAKALEKKKQATAEDDAEDEEEVEEEPAQLADIAEAVMERISQKRP